MVILKAQNFSVEEVMKRKAFEVRYHGNQYPYFVSDYIYGRHFQITKPEHSFLRQFLYWKVRYMDKCQQAGREMNDLRILLFQYGALLKPYRGGPLMYENTLLYDSLKDMKDDRTYVFCFLGIV